MRQSVASAPANDGVSFAVSIKGTRSALTASVVVEVDRHSIAEGEVSVFTSLLSLICHDAANDDSPLKHTNLVGRRAQRGGR
jgi:hypothetical protein